jgi:Type I phosphodiesterase / nucleotide pyrophosphatase
MAVDDIPLLVQRGLDRLIRRVRIGRSPGPTHRRLIVVQIDGLSAEALDRALLTGRMPFLRRLMARHGHRRRPMAVGMPTSTPAFQMAAMYGVQPDIPGFHYHDKRRRMDIHFPRAGHAALVEEDHTRDRTGVLAGGSVYGCVFTGGADDALFSFTRLTRPTRRGLASIFSGSVVVGWVILKSLALSLREIALMVARIIREPGAAKLHWQWLQLHLALSVWVRQLFTLAVSRDLYAGLPAIYVNFLDYDVSAHAFSPQSRHALDSLRGIDSSIRQIWRVIRRVPGHGYDLFVLADHGQAACVDFRSLSGGEPFERVLIEELAGRPIAPATRGGRESSYRHGLQTYHIGRPRPEPAAEPLPDSVHEESGGREAYQRAGIRVVSAGPNAFIYFLDSAEPLDADEIERRLPGSALAVAKVPGVGFVLARSPEGPVVYWRGEVHRLGKGEAGPFADRPDREVVLRGIGDLMAMRSAGDLVVYGIGAPEGNVSYVPEVGAHAGPSPEELHTFLIQPASVEDRGPVRHPLELYDLFARYQTERATLETREDKTARPTPG